MDIFSRGPNYSKLKTNLNLSVHRLKLLEKKKTELAQKARREISEYIRAGKDDRARIRVEQIVREDYLVEAMELLEMFCDLLTARMGLIESQKTVDEGLEESIASIIWATPRLQSEVGELKAVTDQLTAKYGKDFVEACKCNDLNNVSERLMHKLSVEAPPKLLVEQYMIEIAKSFNIPFEPDRSVLCQDEAYLAENLLGNPWSEKNDGMPVLEPKPAENHSIPAPSVTPYPPPSVSPFQPPTQPVVYPPPPPPTDNLYPPGTPHYDPPTGPAANANPSSNGGLLNFDLPTVPSGSPSGSMPQPPGSTSAGGESVNFDDLERRFQALKKKK